MGTPERQATPPPEKPKAESMPPAGGGCSFLAVLGIALVLGAGAETYENIQNYDPLNPPQVTNKDPFSWVAVPVTELYVEIVGYPNGP